ncbi:MAG: WecB/TagA/CpsF family glycosyltransferase [Moorellaceae bacterium]
MFKVDLMGKVGAPQGPEKSSRRILGCRVDGPTLDEALEMIAEFVSSGTPHYIVTLNAEIAYRASREPRLLEIINRASLVTPDGAGIVWAARWLGKPVPERVTGIDLLEALASKAADKGWRLFLFGAAPGIAEKARDRLVSRYPGLKVVGTAHGYLSSGEERDMLVRLKSLHPDILLVALGSPKQEYWIHRHLSDLGVPVAMGVGGALDVLAGEVRRAPLWMQRCGLEWLYRLLSEPKRIKRAWALPKFLWGVVRQILSEGRSSAPGRKEGAL